MTRPKNISDEDWRKREKKYYENRTEEQKERKNATTREWRANLSEEQKERRREAVRRSRMANLDKYRISTKLRFREARDDLHDPYVRELLRRVGFVNPSQELIELKRVQLKIRRYLNQ